MKKLLPKITLKALMMLLVTILQIYLPKLYGQTCGTVSILSNSGFESGVTSWDKWNGTMTTVSSPVHSGSQSCYLSGRTGQYTGPVYYLPPTSMQTGKLYCFSAWARYQTRVNGKLTMSLKVVDGNGTNYYTIAESDVFNNRWTELANTGFYVDFNGTPSSLTLYVFSSDATNLDSYYVDDFAMTEMQTVTSWKDTTNKYIDIYRKRDLQVNITDGVSPVNGATVHIKQLKNDFPFGTCVNYWGLTTASDSANYNNFIRSNYNWACPEFEFEWTITEQSQNSFTYAYCDYDYNFFQQNGLKTRGSLLLWGDPGDPSIPRATEVPNWAKSLSNANLKTAIDNRLTGALGRYNGKSQNYVVNNEMVHWDYFKGRLGDTIEPWMYKRAKAISPNTPLFVNDFDNIEGSTNEDFHRHISDLLAAGAPINAIGCQAHFWTFNVNYNAITAKLNRLADFGLPIWITEYDAKEPDVNKRADKLETLYRTAFSHPSVEGIFMWGFWSERQWIGADAAIVDKNWTVNAAGLRYQSLLKEWKTDSTELTNISGIANFRGFHGDYIITISKPGCTTVTDTFSLHKGTGKKVLNYALSCTSTSVTNNKIENKFEIFPNPATNEFYVEVPKTTERLSLVVCNIEGKEIIKEESVINKKIIDVSMLPRGVYFVKLISQNTVEVKKLTVN